MKYLVNSREMKSYDNNTTEKYLVPSIVLMERAAVAFVEKLCQLDVDLSKVLIVCGTGNNGGDGFAIARLLMQKDCDVDVVLVADKDNSASKSNQQQRKIWTAYQQEIKNELPKGKHYTAVIDAIFGIGLSRNVEGLYAESIEKMNQMQGYKIAVDIPSGVSADNGTVLGCAFRADITISFAYEKVGTRLWPGAEYAGTIYTEEMGINKDSWMERKPSVVAYEESDLSFLAERPAYANKGTFGKLLLIAGSNNMAGAACLAAQAAYAAGCGLVRVLTPEENRVILQTLVPEAILTTYSSKKIDISILSDAINWADVIVCGPGIGMTDTAEQLVKSVLKIASVPVLFDADALNLIAKDTNILLHPHTELVLTPHLGEMSRLVGDSTAYISNRLIEVAEEFARQYNVICVLKDARTVTGVPYGQTYLNLSGNSGMATAGSGDVLSGIIGGFMAQGMPPEQAAAMGVYVHGKAGDLMALKSGKRGLMASELVEGIKLLAAEQEERVRK